MMATRSVACIFFIVCFLSKAYSQSSCPPNLDLESGTFANWECFTGTTDTFAGKNRMLLNPTLPIPGRHEIISAATAPALDRFGGFPKLCPYGGNFSVQLGNEGTGAEAEAISYTFVVPTTVDTFTFTYFYAVVFEDPGHTPPEQPRFFVTAYDVGTGDLINCASFDYIATSLLPGFTPSPMNGSVLYKPWTPTSLQFAGLGGHTVRLEFRTADCTRSGHFGYAYLDVASACSNILATAPYCIETNSLILDAPFGFKNYTWYKSDQTTIVGSGQSVTLSPPPVTSGVFYVDVEPYPGFGCRDTLQAFVTPLPVPALPDADTAVKYCQFQTAVPLSARVLPGNTLLWYTSATGGIGTSTAPVPSTATAGILKYYVSQKALFGCEGFRREITVTIKATPYVSFNVNSNLRQCQVGNSYSFTSNSTNLDKPGYTWIYGDGQTYSSTDIFSVYSYSGSGYFTVKLKVTNDSTCSAENSQTVTVIPKPIATFSYPIPICENQTVVTLTDRSSVPAGIATIIKWWWNINGKIVQSQTPPSSIEAPGPYPVKLVVTTTEGCRSDTNTTILNIRYRPLTEFGIGDLMCNNEVIRFTDQSSFPPGATGETVTKWNWTFDNAITAATQNVYTYFDAGLHKVRLMSESSEGCKSIPLEKGFEIFPKPIVRLEDINDSCVFIPITYRATDLVSDPIGSVVKYSWYFTDGFKVGPTTLTKTYKTEGNKSFSLITQTIKGCKDTIYRPFTIYDNKSFAGNDTLAAFDEPVQLDARGEPGMQYNWSPLTGLDHGDIEKPVATYDKDQLYHLYTVTNKGCKKQTQIFIKRWAGPDLYIPNAFTPNNDGVNDVLRVKVVGIKSFGYLAVYNRWGQMVYRTTNYHDGWDGTAGGLPCRAETYVYIVQATDYKGKPLVRKGTVILIR
jgi:gliding motility-associated-like protein